MQEIFSLEKVLSGTGSVPVFKKRNDNETIDFGWVDLVVMYSF